MSDESILSSYVAKYAKCGIEACENVILFTVNSICKRFNVDYRLPAPTNYLVNNTYSIAAFLIVLSLEFTPITIFRMISTYILLSAILHIALAASIVVLDNAQSIKSD